MDDHLGGFHDDPAWVAAAAHLEPVVEPEPPAEPRNHDARRALAFAILGVAVLGVIFGPLALALGQRARLALVADQGLRDRRGARFAHAAIAIGKVAFALHLALWASIIPWLLFVLPLVGPGR